MKVFISWSGDKSRGIADVLRKWLPGVLQSVKPYFSPDDIAKGARWEGEISKELEASRVGLLVLTPDNLDAPWLLFEAGALAKNLEKSKVCPLLFALEPTDVKGPLVQFQSARFDEVEMKRVVKMINAELGESSLGTDVLDQVFEMWWPRLDALIAEQLKTLGPQKEKKARTEKDILEEVLALARSLAKDDERRNEISPGAIIDLMDSYRLLLEELLGSPLPGASEAARRMFPPMEYIAERSSARVPQVLRREIEMLLDKTSSFRPRPRPKKAEADISSP